MLEDKSKELGRIIGQSPEYQAVKRANDTLMADNQAVALLRQIQQLRVDAQMLIERGQEPPVEMEEQLDALAMQVQQNPAHQRALVAQENFDKLMMRVNEWIMEGIRRGATSSIITLG